MLWPSHQAGEDQYGRIRESSEGGELLLLISVGNHASALLVQSTMYRQLT